MAAPTTPSARRDEKINRRYLRFDDGEGYGARVKLADGRSNSRDLPSHWTPAQIAAAISEAHGL